MPSVAHFFDISYRSCSYLWDDGIQAEEHDGHWHWQFYVSVAAIETLQQCTVH